MKVTDKPVVICQRSGSLPCCPRCEHGKPHREVWEYPGPKKCSQTGDRLQGTPKAWFFGLCRCKCVECDEQGKPLKVKKAPVATDQDYEALRTALEEANREES